MPRHNTAGTRAAIVYSRHDPAAGHFAPVPGAGAVTYNRVRAWVASGAAVMKLAHLYDSLRADVAVVAEAFEVDLSKHDGSKTGLATLWRIMTVISRNRAYDDAHPGFASGQWKRVLPHDGRDYCWYYAGGADDTHVATLLKKISKSFAA